jgi:hypothetical protein
MLPLSAGNWLRSGGVVWVSYALREKAFSRLGTRPKAPPAWLPYLYKNIYAKIFIYYNMHNMKNYIVIRDIGRDTEDTRSCT